MGLTTLNHEDTLEILYWVGRFTTGKQGCLESIVNLTVECSEMAWNKTVKFQEMAERTENKKDIYLAEEGKTAMAWTLSGKVRTDWKEAQAAWEVKRESDIVEKDLFEALTRQEEMARDLEKCVFKISPGNQRSYCKRTRRRR